MNKLWGFISIFPILFILGCESSAVLKAGGYRMIHMNNPECMGASASGVVLVQDITDQIVKANISHKTGYCESITGQVIDTGGEVAGQMAVGQGLRQSGNSVNATTSSAGGSSTLPGPAPMGGEDL
jgi:hypothetical protein